MRTIFSILMYSLLAVILILLILVISANQHDAKFVLDPITPENPMNVLVVELPMWLFAFIVFFFGMLFGRLVTFFAQSKHRRAHREQKWETARWRREAMRHQEDNVPSDADKSILARFQ